MTEKSPGAAGNFEKPADKALDQAVATEPALREVMGHLEAGRAEQARALCREVIEIDDWLASGVGR